MLNLTLSENTPFEAEINYWKDKLRWIKPLNLFTDSARSDKKGNNKRSSEFVLNEKLKKQLNKFSDDQKVSLLVTLLSAYKVLLSRYSAQDDICVGNVITLDNQQTDYLNTLPLRTEINSTNCFEELLQSVNNTVSDAYQHQNVPFEKLKGLISEEADWNSNLLFKVMFVFQNGVAVPSELTRESDLTLFIKEQGAGLAGRIEYNSNLYNENTICRIIDHYKILLNSILANPKKSIGLLPMLTETEEHKLLNELNDTAFDYPKDKSLIDLFEQQAKKTPDNIAVIFNELEISYKELNILGNQFGDYLRKTYLIKADDLVGLKLERDEWLIIAIIGILKAGGAYVPIDPDYPPERINYIVNDSACKVFIDKEEINRFRKIQAEYSKENLKSEAKANNLVYCIYTSGSTGNPKGVLVEHRNVVNLIWSQREVYKITADERVLQFTTITFDPSAEQFWIAFLTGAALVVPDKATVSDLKALENYIIIKKVTHIHTVPVVLAELSIEDLSNVKRVITGGESCSPSLVEKWKGCFMFINEYGPTETTITSIEYKAEQSDKYYVFVPIGRPVANTDIYILGDHQQLLPFGALGEIYIGGDGVSRGYLNRPELTKERFIADPFKTGKRMYRTGDLGRWLPDGNIEYLGRIDDQVKIRGFRIELDEITSTLLRHPKVNAAVVIAKAIKGQDKELIAYTAGAAESIDLRNYLKDQLPSYMVPGHYVHMDTIPLTSNGKVNKKVLPMPENSGLANLLYIAPSTEIEWTLVKIWAEVLNLSEEIVSIKSDFFDLGGHSIKAIRLRGLIHKKLGVKLSIRELFLENTIELQAKSIANRQINVYEEQTPVINAGKIGKKGLPIPESYGIFKQPHITPSIDIEKALMKLWAKVLNLPEKALGQKNNFFDMGGNSIKAIRLLGLIHKELGVKLPLNELFSKGTIERQASMIVNKKLNSYEVIGNVPEAEEYKLSSAQKRLWILNHFEGAQSAYNIPYVISLEGNLNKVALKDAFKAIAIRHEILRTAFKENSSGAVFQEVTSPDKYVFELKETNLTQNADKHAILNQIIELESFGGFDFIEGPLWRCHLIQLDESKHVLVMVHHHIISDGWSMDIFRKEWCMLYNAYSSGSTPQLAPLRIQYKDYAAWHNTQLLSDDILLHKEYWIKQFEGEIPILELPAEKERPAVKTFNGRSIITAIDDNVLDKLNRTGKIMGGTLFMTLLACVNALIYRYTGQEDIVIGSPTAGREHPDLENQIGFYINTLAIRTRFDGLDSYEALYEHIKEVTLSAYEHQIYPYDELVDSLKLPRNINRNPLFDVMVVLQNSMEQDAEFTLNGLHTGQYKTAEYRVAKFDLNFIFSESKNGLELVLEYNTDIYSDEQMHLMLRHLENLMAAVAHDSKQSIAAIDILTKEDKHKLFDEFNDTLVYYPKEKTLAGIFEEQVLKTPDAIALRQHNKTMTYRELNERANQLANYLIENGINKGDNVALLVTRNFHMIVGMFGILKAGGAYVPIDPEYPIDRQEYILRNSSVKIIVTDGEYSLAKLVSPGLFANLREIDLGTYSKENPGLDIDSTQLAYTIYTSGSTGRPKGVMIEHHMAVNLVLWVNTEFNVGPDDRLLFITSMCFDLSVYDIFGMLSAGGSLVIVQQNELLDVPRLKDMMLTYKITFWDTVPTTMDYLVRELESHDKSFLQKTLRVVFMSGDWIPVNLPDRIKVYFPNTRVISLGGATEGTVWSNFYPVEKVGANWGSIPYGRPMNNNFFYILNEKLQPVPIGVVGELYIGGVGVARGYANDKEKTDYAFVKDPFNDQAGSRMYRTGDLGRMLPDLNMEFIGRKDDQVKIRGYRIELGEIESVLRQCEQVSQAVVLAKSDRDKKKRLVGYVVGKAGYDRTSVITSLKSKLPDYMVPTLWMEVDNIPLTANGKIDKKSLPEFNAEEQIKDQYVAPHTESERLLVKIWEDVLRVGNIGITHDFFDLGGHSLLAVQIVNQIKKHTGKILPISVLFKYSNIESLNAFLNENDTEKVSKSLVPIKPSGNKMPVYFIHGVGLNVMNFADLAMYLDKEQPVFGIQALGLGGKFPPVTTITEIAKIYVSEIIEHNPNGPYAIAGYSLGGFIATEMRKQFEALNKEVSVLAIIDTYADYTDNFFKMLPKKLDRHIRKWINLGISFIGNPNKTIEKQRSIYLEDKQYRYDAIKLAKESGDKEFYKLMKHIRSTYYDSYRRSKMEPFDGFVHLFRATDCLHYTDDKVYLGWRKYAKRGVKEFLIPGDHRTMLLKPNVEAFARALQEVLDNSVAINK